ncbi:hypothetical protein FOA52_004717 [Chlamydomonas sp. UWO 241]|nr:hypothetical protein FOA52_004717 [Chlamydomonas sp. UWO 241]
MEERVTLFMTEAQRLSAAGDAGRSSKEIAKLCKFVFKNQEHRFSDREQSHLFQAVQVHVARAPGVRGAPLASEAEGEQFNSAALGLLEDTLKMPFNVFGTAHKRSFLKWHSKLTGEEAGGGGGGGGGGGDGGGAARKRVQVIDAQRTAGGSVTLTLMSSDGDTADVGPTDMSSEAAEGGVLEKVAAAFEAGRDVELTQTSS